MQLVRLINAELDFGIRHAQQALKSSDRWADAEDCNHRAKRVYAKLVRLIPMVSEITEVVRCYGCISGNETTSIFNRIDCLRDFSASFSEIALTQRQVSQPRVGVLGASLRTTFSPFRSTSVPREFVRS
jgi:hypothetical protein